MKHSSVLEVSGVTVRFGGLTALDAVSLAVAPGEIVGVIGPNGAGKTTLLNVLCGFIRPDAGQVLIDGRRLPAPAPAPAGRARRRQDAARGGPVRAADRRENVMTGANCRATAGFLSAVLGLPRSDRDERRLRDEAGQALDRVGAGEAADARPGELPYGMRKRVALARALAARPKLLLLDEPASGLAEDELAELGVLLRELAAETSLVIVEHHMDLMMSVCDSLVVLDFGKVISRGTPKEIQADPAVATAYLGTSGPGGE